MCKSASIALFKEETVPLPVVSHASNVIFRSSSSEKPSVSAQSHRVLFSDDKSKDTGKMTVLTAALSENTYDQVSKH